jgi:hypothetical protein
MAGIFPEFSKCSPFCQKTTFTNFSQRRVKISIYGTILLGLLKDMSGKMFDQSLLALKISSLCDDVTDIAHFCKNMDLPQVF